MKELNNVTLAGNLTADPEMRHTLNGTAITQFSIANNRDWKNGEVENKKVNFIRCTAWGKTAENIIKFFSKGKKICVVGELDHQSWDDKESGKKRSNVEIKVHEFYFMEGKADKNTDDNGAKVDKDDIDF